MSQTPYPFSSATDLQGWITAPGESVAESIDQDITTYWNPIGATGNHTFSWIADWSSTSHVISGVGIFCRLGTEPDRIKVWSNTQVMGGVLLGNFNNPVWNTTIAPGYSFFDCSGWAPLSLSYVHLELQQQHNGPFNLNEVVAYYQPPPPVGKRPLLKRSPIGRESFKFPGRQKPRWSSYQETPTASSDVI